MAITALKSAVNLGASTANVFAAGGIGANPDHAANTFDLNHVAKHNFIEHDVSLTRNDSALGSNCDFDKDVWKGVWDVYVNEVPVGGDKVTSWHSASKARYQRLLKSKRAHEEAGKEWHYGIKEVVLSYGESALLLNVLGKDGIAPLEWIRILVGTFGSPLQPLLTSSPQSATFPSTHPPSPITPLISNTINTYKRRRTPPLPRRLAYPDLRNLPNNDEQSHVQPYCCKRT